MSSENTELQQGFRWFTDETVPGDWALTTSYVALLLLYNPDDDRLLASLKDHTEVSNGIRR